ncbi:MAG: glycosyltransferase family 2 protein [Bacteroidota bacterium]
MGISAVVIALNEAENLPLSLPPLLRVAQEVLVVDTGSTDQTIAIARSLGARVIETPWLGYSATKNWANKQAQYNWILSIDADEVLSPELETSILQWSPRPKTVYSLDRLNYYCGQAIYHSGWYPDWKVRLFDRQSVQWEGNYVHEDLAIPVGKQTLNLIGKLHHYSYQNSQDHWERIERYAHLSAQKLLAKGKTKVTFKRLFSPTARFLRTLILKRSFLDGKAGWTIAVRNAYMVRRKYQILAE